MKLWRKLKGRRGFSLAECLVAMLILTMMSMVACMGITTALQDRAKAITVADAQSVASTAAQAVADQVRYGRITDVGTDYIELTSSTYGARVRLKADGGRLVAQSVDGAGSPVGAPYALLGEMAYSDLTVDELTFQKHESAPGVLSSVDISLTVAGGIWSLQWTVAPLNPRIMT